MNVVLNNAHDSLKLIAPHIQRDIINAAAIEITNAVIEIGNVVIRNLGDEWFKILVDECRDVYVKEQMRVVICYVNTSRCIIERFLGLVYVQNTSSVSLKECIDSLLSTYGLSISSLRGQGYDGAGNLQVSKKRLEAMRDDGWETVLNEVSTFCAKHNVNVPNMEDAYVVRGGRSRSPILLCHSIGGFGTLGRQFSLTLPQRRTTTRISAAGWFSSFGVNKGKGAALPEIVKAGNPVLHEPADEVPPQEIGSEKIQKIIEDMVAAMRKAPGIDLAAPQISVPLKVAAKLQQQKPDELNQSMLVQNLTIDQNMLN
ncbi:zinc finger MYM-type protein 1-like [Canna indica]|uniref:peptide deformylase n=1 Tax=Canna indica TaxID=4628 RepID=A0AAQ3Q305_9LILI|nr:zinc finger MYM-type protein 1-like [Canna indica]